MGCTNSKSKPSGKKKESVKSIGAQSQDNTQDTLNLTQNLANLKDLSQRVKYLVSQDLNNYLVQKNAPFHKEGGWNQVQKLVEQIIEEQQKGQNIINRSKDMSIIIDQLFTAIQDKNTQLQAVSNDKQAELGQKILTQIIIKMKEIQNSLIEVLKNEKDSQLETKFTKLQPMLMLLIKNYTKTFQIILTVTDSSWKNNTGSRKQVMQQFWWTSTDLQEQQENIEGYKKLLEEYSTIKIEIKGILSQYESKEQDNIKEDEPEKKVDDMQNSVEASQDYLQDFYGDIMNKIPNQEQQQQPEIENNHDDDNNKENKNLLQKQEVQQNKEDQANKSAQIYMGSFYDDVLKSRGKEIEQEILNKSQQKMDNKQQKDLDDIDDKRFSLDEEQMEDINGNNSVNLDEQQHCVGECLNYNINTIKYNKK